jgi:hypothetical protein
MWRVNTVAPPSPACVGCVLLEYVLNLCDEQRDRPLPSHEHVSCHVIGGSDSELV